MAWTDFIGRYPLSAGVYETLSDSEKSDYMMYCFKRMETSIVELSPGDTIPGTAMVVTAAQIAAAHEHVIDPDIDPTIEPEPVIDPCVGVTCPNVCKGFDLYSQKCVDGVCVDDAVIVYNSPTCGYVFPSCVGHDLHSRKYIDGVLTDVIEANSPTCGYTPPPPPPPPTPSINCETGGCGLLNLYDIDNDGKVTSSDALRAQNDGRSTEEVQFILAASAAGSINAKCPECYTPAHIPKFSVGDQLCCDHEDIKHWFTRPREITGITSSSYMTEGLQVPFDWDPYMHICVEEEPPVDACTGITCPNICSDGSLFSQKCVDGICVKDILLKSPANAPECYVPPDEEPDTGEPDDEPDDEVPDIMPGQTCVGSDLHQLISGGLIGDLIEANSPKCPSAPPEDKGIFGDLDTKWIIIAVIGIIILGLLS